MRMPGKGYALRMGCIVVQKMGHMGLGMVNSQQDGR